MGSRILLKFTGTETNTRMAHSEVTDEIAAAVEEVWKFFGWHMEDERLRQLTEMGALPGTVSWSGDRPGATRTILTADVTCPYRRF